MIRTDFFHTFRRATLIAACLAPLASLTAWGQHAACGGRCQYGVEGACNPQTVSFGHYQATWRRWPEPPPAIPEFPDPRPRVTPDRPGVELPAPLQEESINPEFPHIRQRQRELHRMMPPAELQPAGPAADPFRDENESGAIRDGRELENVQDGVDLDSLPFHGRGPSADGGATHASRRNMPPHLMRAQYEQSRARAGAAVIRPTGGEAPLGTGGSQSRPAAAGAPTQDDFNPLRRDLAPVLTPVRSQPATTPARVARNERAAHPQTVPAPAADGEYSAPQPTKTPAIRQASPPRPNPLRSR